jgi:hypothetical protein
MEPQHLVSVGQRHAHDLVDKSAPSDQGRGLRREFGTETVAAPGLGPPIMQAEHLIQPLDGLTADLDDRHG